MGAYSLVKIVKSTKPNKKLMAVFKNKKTGREKTVHFGDASMSDYTRPKPTQKRFSYRRSYKSRFFILLYFVGEKHFFERKHSSL